MSSNAEISGERDDESEFCVPVAHFRFKRIVGDVAQLVEHLLCKQGVGGSSPLVSTTLSQVSGFDVSRVYPRQDA
jgi:hypothetical protein